jgi:hypothetical protein
MQPVPVFKINLLMEYHSVTGSPKVLPGADLAETHVWMGLINIGGDNTSFQGLSLLLKSKFNV